MDVFEKIKWLTDKKGLAIPMTTIGRYCGNHPTTITYYLKGATPRQEVIDRYEEGINQLLKDITEKMGE